jgi:hypothetical protein
MRVRYPPLHCWLRAVLLNGSLHDDSHYAGEGGDRALWGLFLAMTSQQRMRAMLRSHSYDTQCLCPLYGFVSGVAEWQPLQAPTVSA